MTEAAITHVNGLPLQPAERQPLQHLDRIILGPCRLLALSVPCASVPHPPTALHTHHCPRPALTLPAATSSGP